MYQMPVNVLIAQYYGFDRVTAIADDEYLLEIQVNTEGINEYEVIDIDSGEIIQEMEYDNLIRYTIPKEMLTKYKLRAVNGNLNDIILDYKIRYVGGSLNKEQVNLDELIIK